MKEKKPWLQARERHKNILKKAKKVIGGTIIAALVAGPLLYFSVFAENITDPGYVIPQDQQKHSAPLNSKTKEQVSETPIKFPEKKLEKLKNKDLKLEIEPENLPEEALAPEIVETTLSGDLSQGIEDSLSTTFKADPEQTEITRVKTEVDTISQEILFLKNIEIDDNKKEIKNKDDADVAARNTAKKYLQTMPKTSDQNFTVLKDTSKLATSKKEKQLVLTETKNHANKWYVTFQQYNNGILVNNGTLKLIFGENKKLLTISDNIKHNLSDPEDLVVGVALAEETSKTAFAWDDEVFQIDFVEQVYDENELSYKIEVESQINGDNFEIIVDGKEPKINKISNNIRLQDSELPATSEVVELPLQETPATGEIFEETPITTLGASEDPELLILDIFLSQILGKIYPQTPNQQLVTEPIAHQYTYVDQVQLTTDDQGYFENENQSWYSVFLDGPYVTVTDDSATANAEIINTNPADPFIWDADNASLAAINAFYHTNAMRDYFADTHLYEITKNIPLTVNSELVDAYMQGCGAWFNNADKTIEMGRGGYERELDGIASSCPTDLNYALSSDMVYHEYAHFVVEEVTHLPNIYGAESAAMGEGLADYFAASINDDSVWGDVVSPNRTRDLSNALNYQTDMTGGSHHDGQILAGALWDLREQIGTEETDQLIFNTLYQDRYHFETFMYGMIIEDDDNDDFSDGTPHLIAIITAFGNHGIGPGVANFNGLPITPEAWTLILEEQAPEGEEDLLQGLWTGTCTWSAGIGSNLTVNSGTCYSYSIGDTVGSITINSGGTLQIAYPLAGYPATVTASGNVTVNTGGTLNVGTSYGNAGTLTANAYVYNYGTINLGNIDGDGTLVAPYSATFQTYNYGTINVGNGTSAASQGIITSGTRVQNYQNAIINFGNGTSTGSMTQSSYYLANWAGATTNIYSGSNVQVVSLPVYENVTYGDATVDVRSGGTLTVNNNANIGVPQAEPTPDMLGGILTSAGTVTIGGTLAIYSGGTTQVNAGTITADTTLVDDNVPGNDGVLTINDTGTLDTVYLNVGDATYEGGIVTINTGGTFDVERTSTITSSGILNIWGDFLGGTGLSNGGMLVNAGADVNVRSGGTVEILVTSAGFVGLEVDGAGSTFTVYDDDNSLDMDVNVAVGSAAVLVDNGGTLTVQSQGFFDHNGGGAVTIDGGTLSLEHDGTSTGEGKFQTGQPVTISNSANVNIGGLFEANDDLTINSSALVNVLESVGAYHGWLDVGGSPIIDGATTRLEVEANSTMRTQGAALDFSQTNSSTVIIAGTLTTADRYTSDGTNTLFQVNALGYARFAKIYVAIGAGFPDISVDGGTLESTTSAGDSIIINDGSINLANVATGEIIFGGTTAIGSGALFSMSGLGHTELDGDVVLDGNMIIQGGTQEFGSQGDPEYGDMDVNGALVISGTTNTHLNSDLNINNGGEFTTTGSLFTIGRDIKIEEQGSLTQNAGTINFGTNAFSTGGLYVYGNSSNAGSFYSSAGTITGEAIIVNSGRFRTEATTDMDMTSIVDFNNSNNNTVDHLVSIKGDLDTLSTIYIYDDADVDFIPPFVSQTYSFDAMEVQTGATVDTNTQAAIQLSTASGGLCADTCGLAVGTDVGAAANLNINGDLLMTSGAGDAQVGADGTLTINSGGLFDIDATAGSFDIAGTVNDWGEIQLAMPLNLNAGAYLEVDGAILNSTSTAVPSYNQVSTGELYADSSANIDFAGTAVIDGTFGLVDGTFDCDTSLLIDDNAIMSVGNAGVVTVNGSDTTIDGALTLDGTLDGGNVTVTSTGTVSSSLDLATNNFKILAEDLTVDSLGCICSDAVSSYDSGLTSTTGSYGGEGIGEDGGTTYGATKQTWPVNNGNTGSDASGGGAVYIEATGNIDINGTISANGGTTTDGGGEGAGSGGTVMIVHNIATSDTTKTFTGTGTIEAHGGDAIVNDFPAGGGRIVIDSPLLDNPDTYDFSNSNVGAYGGENGNEAWSGAPGTIVYLGDDNNPDGTLLVDYGPSGEVTDGNGTVIPDVGNLDFNRVELTSTETFIDFSAVSSMAEPDVCYNKNYAPGVIMPAFQTCNDYPDKPDTLYINTTAIGAQSGSEPFWNATVTVPDFTPAFSVMHRNPDGIGAGDATVAAVQVADNADFSNTGGAGNTVLWDTTLASIDGGSVTPGDRTGDIEYAGATLSELTDYYVRIALIEGSDQGLWTHRDIGDYYVFQVEEPDCDWIGNDLTVASGKVCFIDGTDSGDTVTVESGGTLTLGSNSVTAFTVNTTMDVQGDVIVGHLLGHDKAWNSNLITATADIEISNGGTLTTQSNTSGDNYLTVDGAIYVGTSGSTSGTLTLSDITTPANTAEDLYIYDDDGGTALDIASSVDFTIDDASGTAETIMYNSSAFTNAGDFQSERFQVGDSLTDTPTFTNTGTVYTTDVSIYGLRAAYGTVNNSGTITVDGAVTVVGGATNEGNFTQTTGTTTASSSASIYTYGRIDIDGGIFTTPYLGITGTGADNGVLDIGASGEVAVTNTLTIGTASGTDESGTLTNYGDLSNAPLINIWDDSTWTNYSGATAAPQQVNVYKTGVITNQAATIIHANLTLNIYGDGTLNQSGNLLGQSINLATNASYPGTGSGATMTSSSGTFTTLTGDVQLGHASTLGGVWNINSGSNVNMTATGSDLSIFDSTASLTNYGNFDLDGKLYVAGGGTATIDSFDTSDIGSIQIESGSSGTSTVDINTLVNLNSYHDSCAGAGGSPGDHCLIEVGYQSGAGSSLLNLTGIINALSTTNDADVVIGDAGNGKFNIDGGWLDVDETLGSFNVNSYSPYGFYVLNNSTVDLEMPLNIDEGYVYVDGAGVSPADATLDAKDLTMTSTSSARLYVMGDDSVTIEGAADVDGDLLISGTMTVNDCTKLAAPDSENSLYVYATGAFTTGDGTCALSGTEATDGLNIQGELYTDSGGTIDVTGDMTFDDADSSSIWGVFDVSEILRIKNESEIYLDHSAAPYTAKSLLIDHPITGSTKKTLFDIDSSATLNLSGEHTCGISACAVEIAGYYSSSYFAHMNVYGTLNVLSSSTGDIEINDGYMYISGLGVFNDDATSGTFSVIGSPWGYLYAYGNLNIANQPLNSTQNIIVGNVGTIDSSYSGASENTVGYFNVDGQALFDDSLTVGYGNRMLVDGYIEAAGAFTFDSITGTAANVSQTGEIKVTGVDSTMTFADGDVELHGKLNAADGDGDIDIQSGVNIIRDPGGTDNSFFYIHTRDFTLGGTINVDDFAACTNPIGTQTYGGSYGGQGGNAATPNDTFGSAKYSTAPAYSGTLNPVGMCGFTSSGDTKSVNGGGAVFIEATGDVAINGNITADGTDLTADNRGAGSGGLIVIKQNPTLDDATFTGSGTISADGGGGTTGTARYPGGGGRIVIDTPLYDDPDTSSYSYSGSIHADGGAVGTTYAAAGTVAYIGDDNNPNGTVIVDQGNNGPSGGLVTEIPNTGTPANFTFDRLEARNGADITFAADPGVGNDPIACYAIGAGSSVDTTYIACNDYPDKPDTVHVNSTGGIGSEPSYGSPVTITDLTPAFSFIHKNPEDINDATQAAVQVVSTPANFTGGPYLWDTSTYSITAADSSTLFNGERSSDIEYGGSTLSVSTPYYFRMATIDSGGQGLWTHRDIGDYYQFDLSEPCDWSGPGGDLTVPDGAVCEINGIGETAGSITVDRGGTLLVGNQSQTDFTASTSIDIQGDVIIGAVDSGYTAKLATTTANMIITNTGDVTISANSTSTNELDVNGTLSLGNGLILALGTITNNDTVNVSGTIILNDGGLITNNSTFEADNVTTPITIGTNNADIVNTGTLTVRGPLTLDYDVAVDNTGTLDIVTAGHDLIMNSTSSIANSGSGIVNVPDDLDMNESSTITNSGSADFNVTDILQNDITATTQITISGGTFDVTGYTYNYFGNDLDISAGTLTTLHIGIGVNGGTAGGTVDVSGTGVLHSTSTSTQYLNKGTLTNTSSADPAVDIDGAFYLNGTIGEVGTFNNQGIATLGTTNIYNYGAINNTGSSADLTVNYFNMYNTADMTNDTSATFSATSSFAMNDASTFLNSGSAIVAAASLVTLNDTSAVSNTTGATFGLNGNITMNDDSTVSNAATAIFNAGDGTGDYTYIYANDSGGTSSTFTNSGTFNGGRVYIGNSSIDGGTFNNEPSSTFILTGDRFYLYRGGEFYNKSEATVTVPGTLRAGGEVGKISTYYQEEGSTTGVKTSATALYALAYGKIDIYDEVTVNNMQASTGGHIETIAPSTGPSISKIIATSTITSQASSTITIGADTELRAQNAFFHYGDLVNNGLVTLVYSNSIQIYGGTIHSSNDSTFDIQGSAGMLIYNSGTPIIELAGNVTGTRIDIEDPDGGYICIGDYDWVDTCSYNASATVDFSAELEVSNGANVDIANNATFRNIQLLPGGVDPGIVRLYGSTSTVTLDGSEACNYLSGYCSLEIGTSSGAITSQLLIEEGTLLINDLSSLEAYVKVHQNGVLTIANGATLDVNETNTTYEMRVHGNGTQDGIFTVDGTADLEYPLYVEGDLIVDSTDATSATLNMVDSYDITSTGTVDQGFTGTVTVEGSTTTISGDYELDGTLDTGTDEGDTCTITGTGLVHSGIGSETRFKLQAHDLTIQSGGRIASDGVSNNLPATAGAGSFGGEGQGRSTGSTYGYTKLVKESDPEYGEAGMDDLSGVDAYGGGGVNIYATGSIDITGDGLSNTISADGADDADNDTGTDGAGSGGAVMIFQEPLTANETFTGNATAMITANGGDNPTSTLPAGGGGRIIIRSPLLDDPDDTSGTEYDFPLANIQAYGGENTADSSYAAAGTITHWGDLNNNYGTLIVDQGSGRTSSQETEIPVNSLYLIDFDTQTVDFGGGGALLGGTSGATANIFYIEDYGTHGFMVIDITSGAFIDNEIITDAGTGSATSDGPSYVFNTFGRIEVRNGAILGYASGSGPAPIACYDSDGTVNDLTCSSYEFADKPDTLYINDTYEGAQTRAETPSGGEPAVGNAVTGLYDLTPVFSVMARNPDSAATDFTHVEIEVASDSGFQTLLWESGDTDNPFPLGSGNEVSDNERTSVDVEYAGDTLSASTTYYVRTRLLDSGANPGLWNHADIGDHYQFTIDGSMAITDSCSGAITIADDYPDGEGGNINAATGERYGNGACTITVDSTYGYWSVLYGKQSGETAFDDATTAYSIDEIDNASAADCSMATEGDGTDEEYGFNIYAPSGSTVINAHIESDGVSECNQDFDNWTQDTGLGGDNNGRYIFDVEDYASADEIIRTDDNTTVSSETFDLNLHTSINTSTEAEDYALGTTLIITTNP